MSTESTILRVLICGKCPGGSQDQGSFAKMFAGELGKLDRLASLDVRIVRCLGGCVVPGNIAVDGGDARIRLSGITPENAAEVTQAVGDIARANDPVTTLGLTLAARVSAISPKRPRQHAIIDVPGTCIHVPSKERSDE